jgi:bacillithiol system protein YtxJ
MKEITSQSAVDALCGSATAVLLKHGATCPISAHARDEIAAFVGAHPEVPVHGLEVTGHRALSDEVASRFGVQHESPQVFILRLGKVAWTAAHYDITSRGLESHLGAGTAQPAAR